MSPGMIPEDRERILRAARELERYHARQAAKYAKRARIAFGVAIFFGCLAIGAQLLSIFTHF